MAKNPQRDKVLQALQELKDTSVKPGLHTTVNRYMREVKAGRVVSGDAKRWLENYLIKVEDPEVESWVKSLLSSE